MKQFLLAVALIAFPVAVFTAVEVWVLPGFSSANASASSDPLGDLSGYETIVVDARDLADAGDFAAAKTRITDFETTWDDAEAAMRPMAPAAWGNVDAAADHAFAALRAAYPDPGKVTETLAALSSALANPAGDGGSAGGVQRILGVAVTDENGHAIPCEAMLDDLRAAMADGSIAAADKPNVTDLRAKATERCNADDDTRADAFAAQALALVSR